mgnify:CR=1 FL=1
MYINATLPANHSLADAVKALLQVWLHRLRVARLAEDLQQLVIGQEVKPADSSGI